MLTNTKQNKRPLDPNLPTGRMSSGSQPFSGKSRTKSRSDASWASATNENGRGELDQHIRSVLSHPLGLALLLAFHDTAKLKEDWPSWMKSFSNLRDDCSVGILEESVAEWFKAGCTEEEKLTDMMTNKINGEKYKDTSMRAVHQVQVKDSSSTTGFVDILLVNKAESEQEKCTPNMLIEVGRHGNDWFKKLYQAIKDLKMMCQEQKPYTFEKPMLLAIVTLEKQRMIGDECDFQIGVFLCSRKKSQSNTSDDKFRMSLLWHSKEESMKEASRLFDNMLAIAQVFGEKRDEFELGGVMGYTYFSSNCCRIKDDVLRMYDNRFRKTSRSAIVYEEWTSLSTFQVLIVEDQGNLNQWFNPNWQAGADLKLIATPYRKGRHFAKMPTDFLPIMDHLQALHHAGFVHGDIRAYNMVFGDRDDSKTPEGWLIDFDFGGKAGQVFYPPGYNRALEDGRRIGREMQKIEKWHDWYAFAHIFIFLHGYDEPSILTSEEEEKQVLLISSQLDLHRTWFRLKTDDDITDAKLKRLRDFLKDIEDGQWTVSFEPCFKAHIEKNEK